MKAGLWIARRFSFARKRFRVINIISAISLAGIIIGVTTLLVVMSVLNGFQKLAHDLFITVDSPVQIVPLQGTRLTVSDTLLQSIRAIEGVGSAEPFAEGEAILATSEKSELVTLKGLTDAAHSRLMRETKASRPFFSGESIAAGELLAYRTNLYAYRSVKLFSPELISFGLQSLSEPYMLPALGIPESSVSRVFSLQKVFDDRYVLASSTFAQKILLLGRGEYSGIDIRGKEKDESDALARSIRVWLERSPLKKTCRVRTLEEKYSTIFAVMQLEKWVSFAVLMLIILVASLSLTGALAMTAIDKQRELFYLRCLGLEKPQFMAIFIIQGAMTGLAGTTAGALIAWTICTLQERYGIVQLPSKSAFIIDAYPVSMHGGDFLIVGLSALALCIAVSIYPALKASSIASSRSSDFKTD
ncbi:MAG: FtsX-like permease family protein [Chlorobiaceae bacterium]